MKEIILYGAGTQGRLFARQLCEHNIAIAGFCDSNKTGEVEFECGGKIRRERIYKPEELSGDTHAVLISIASYADREEVAEQITARGIELVTIEQILSSKGDMVAGCREYVAEFHAKEMDSYFQEAEEKWSMDIFWREDSVFNGMFQKLDADRIVELACGRGRHVPQYAMHAQEIVLVDVLEKNIAYCRERFRGEEKIRYYVNNGCDLRELPSCFCTALFTYDAMVHFEMMDIFQYLKETERVLCVGGRALFHHSNNSSDYRVTFSTGRHGRNYMSKDIFAYLANRAGLLVLEQQVIDWGGEKDLDCITLVEKPKALDGNGYRE